MGRLLTIYEVEASIDVSAGGESAETWALLGEGFDNLSESLNEVVQQYFFLSNKGFATNHTTGMAPAFTLTGRRVIGDPAQDYIFAQKYSLGEGRETKLKIAKKGKDDKTETLTCPVTICNIQEISGASTDNSAISIELRLNGKPEVTTAAV